MPIYEYQCTGCHHTFDLMQKMNDEPVQTCPECFKNTVVRLVSAAGFQLKGTGWYVTDFKNKGQPEKKTSATETGKTTTDTKSTNSTTSSNTTKGEST